jgi:uncharacterized protein (TIGR03086 family)
MTRSLAARAPGTVTRMTSVADRYRSVAGGFTARADAVVDWDVPSPCAGWTARDVVGHLVEWFPPFLEQGAGVTLAAGPDVATDPAGAWRTLDHGVQALLDDPGTATREFHHEYAGDHALADAIGQFFLNDVLVHTWDLARATGQDETLDPDEVASMLEGIEAYDEALRVGGQFGPKVDVPPGADAQTRLLAFLGRRP